MRSRKESGRRNPGLHESYKMEIKLPVEIASKGNFFHPVVNLVDLPAGDSCFYQKRVRIVPDFVFQ